MRTYMDYWGLRERPFDSGAPRYFFLGRQHREAFERVLYIVRDRSMGLGMLTGEIGCGKTMITNVLRAKLPGHGYKVAVLENSGVGFSDFICEVLTQVQPTEARRRDFVQTLRGESLYELYSRFRELLREQLLPARQHLLVILDEAQLLDEQVLVQIKGLTNICDAGEGALTILLFGQVELAAMMHRLPEVDQRIGLRYHLQPLDLAEVERYLAHRLRVAGYRGRGLILPEAVELLHRETGGFPREINRVAKLALDRAFVLRHEQVDAETIGIVTRDIARQKALAYRGPALREGDRVPA